MDNNNLNSITIATVLNKYNIKLCIGSGDQNHDNCVIHLNSNQILIFTCNTCSASLSILEINSNLTCEQTCTLAHDMNKYFNVNRLLLPCRLEVIIPDCCATILLLSLDTVEYVNHLLGILIYPFMDAWRTNHRLDGLNVTSEYVIDSILSIMNNLIIKLSEIQEKQNVKLDQFLPKLIQQLFVSFNKYKGELHTQKDAYVNMHKDLKNYLAELYRYNVKENDTILSKMYKQKTLDKMNEYGSYFDVNVEDLFENPYKLFIYLNCHVDILRMTIGSQSCIYDFMFSIVYCYLYINTKLVLDTKNDYDYADNNSLREYKIGNEIFYLNTTAQYSRCIDIFLFVIYKYCNYFYSKLFEETDLFKIGKSQIMKFKDPTNQIKIHHLCMNMNEFCSNIDINQLAKILKTIQFMNEFMDKKLLVTILHNNHYLREEIKKQIFPYVCFTDRFQYSFFNVLIMFLSTYLNFNKQTGGVTCSLSRSTLDNISKCYIVLREIIRQLRSDLKLPAYDELTDMIAFKDSFAVNPLDLNTINIILSQFNLEELTDNIMREMNMDTI